MENTLSLTKADKVVRKSWAWEMLLQKSVLWEHIIFLNEKKWNLDGPDGFQHYWRDLRKPPRQTKTKKFFKEQGVEVLDWPARSPDLNSIENLWPTVTQRVYSNGQQFDSVAEPTQANQQAWESIETSVLRAVIDSMPHQCAEVIEKKGDKTLN